MIADSMMKTIQKKEGFIKCLFNLLINFSMKIQV